MDNLNLVSTFAEFKELKNIDKSTMIGVLEDVFRHLLIKTYETDENFDVIINPEKGDLEIWRNRTIVEDGTVENPHQQISLTDARKIDSTYKVGEEVAEEIKLADFGRRAVLSLRQNLASRIMDLEKANLFNKYTEKVGEIITGEVYQVWKKEILVLDDDDNELVLPKSEQIPSDFFRKGESVKAIVARVEMKNNSPYIVLSRTAPEFLERLFLDQSQRGDQDGSRLSEAERGVAGDREGRPEYPSGQHADRLRHRRVPRAGGIGRGAGRVQGRDRRVDHRSAQGNRLRYGQERAGAFGRGFG